MTTLFTIVHILACVSLIAVVLLQTGKGADMGATFGTGGSQSVFGAGGGSTFMSKVTTAAAIIFMLTSLTLAYFTKNPMSTSIMPNQTAPAPVQPQQQPMAPQLPPMK
jgi:preprotein translocase subunit SecG